MNVERIKNKAYFVEYDKYGKYIKDSDKEITVEYEIEYVDDLPMKIQDLIKLLKIDGVLDIWLTYVRGTEIVRRVINFEWIKKITFKEYYLEINKQKIFYDAIFDFSKAERW